MRSKLTGWNKIPAGNTWIITSLSYRDGIIKCQGEKYYGCGYKDTEIINDKQIVPSKKECE